MSTTAIEASRKALEAAVAAQMAALKRTAGFRLVVDGYGMTKEVYPNVDLAIGAGQMTGKHFKVWSEFATSDQPSQSPPAVVYDSVQAATPLGIAASLVAALRAEAGRVICPVCDRSQINPEGWTAAVCQYCGARYERSNRYSFEYADPASVKVPVAARRRLHITREPITVQATSQNVLNRIMRNDPDGGRTRRTEADYARFEAWVKREFGERAWRDYKGWGSSEDIDDRPWAEDDIPGAAFHASKTAVQVSYREWPHYDKAGDSTYQFGGHVQCELCGVSRDFVSMTALNAWKALHADPTKVGWNCSRLNSTATVIAEIENCAGSGNQIGISGAQGTMNKANCPVCGRELGVRRNKSGYGTIPKHKPAQKTAERDETATCIHCGKAINRGSGVGERAWHHVDTGEGLCEGGEAVAQPKTSKIASGQTCKHCGRSIDEASGVWYHEDSGLPPCDPSQVASDALTDIEGDKYDIATPKTAALDVQAKVIQVQTAVLTTNPGMTREAALAIAVETIERYPEMLRTRP